MRPKGPNPVDVLVGSRIRLLRKRRKMSQAELGKAVGVTFQQIQKYENGKNRVGAVRLHLAVECTQAAKRFCSFGRIPGGAMNAGDIGSTMLRLRMASMSRFVSASMCQPSTSVIGSSWPGCLAPQRAIVGP